jgi:hypothetical protein
VTEVDQQREVKARRMRTTSISPGSDCQQRSWNGTLMQLACPNHETVHFAKPAALWNSDVGPRLQPSKLAASSFSFADCAVRTRIRSPGVRRLFGSAVARFCGSTRLPRARRPIGRWRGGSGDGIDCRAGCGPERPRPTFALSARRVPAPGGSGAENAFDGRGAAGQSGDHAAEGAGS